MLKTAILFLVAVCALCGQSFQVASVKRSPPEAEGGARSTGAIHAQPGGHGINYRRVNLKAVLAFAYRVDADQIAGPQWLDDERYDIVATLPVDAGADQVPAMLRKLLAERFRMEVHEEVRARKGLALIQGIHGAFLRPADEAATVGFDAHPDHITFTKMTMDQFARSLSGFMGRPVANATDLPGDFDVTLRVTMEELKAGSVMGALDDLGLKLENRAADAKFIVVDKADKIPTEN